MISRRRAPRTLLLAALALFQAQILLASHEIEHLEHVDDGACEVCLSGNAIGSPLASSPSIPLFPPAPATLEQAPVFWPISLSCFHVHHARAPPAPVRS
jgi:hypothetical protein